MIWKCVVHEMRIKMTLLSDPINYLILYLLLPLVVGYFLFYMVIIGRYFDQYKKDTGMIPPDSLIEEWAIEISIVVSPIIQSFINFIFLQSDHDDFGI